MAFVGLDLHKKEIEAAIVDQQGRVRLRCRFPATRAGLRAFAEGHLAPDDQVVVEATFHTWAVAEVLRPYVSEVVVSNPWRTRVIAEARIKTDKVDAQVLAQLLRCDFLPRVWCPDQDTQALRQSTTERAVLCADATRIKNRIHSVLAQRLIEAPPGDLFQGRNRAWLEQLHLDPRGQAALERHVEQLSRVQAEVKQLTDELAREAHGDERVRLLMTLPGVDFAVAQTLLAALGDVQRFASADRAAAYLGLVPSTSQSGEHCYHGPITKQGRSHARWMMVQAAQSAARHPGPLGVFFRRLAKKKNRNVAVVATARKLVTLAWHLLKNGEPYRYALPSTTEAKLSRLRVRATGERRKTGPAKGSPPAAGQGSGQKTKAIPSLEALYATEQLPALKALKTGERKALERMHLLAWERELHQVHRIPKTARPAATIRDAQTTEEGAGRPLLRTTSPAGNDDDDGPTRREHARTEKAGKIHRG